MAGLTEVNRQIVQAVDKTREDVLGSAREEALATVFQQVAQSSGLAIEDAVDNLQNLLTLNAAVVGKAMVLILSGQSSNAIKALTEIAKAVGTAISNYGEIGETAAEVLNGFPQPDSNGSSEESPPGGGGDVLTQP